MHLFLLVLQFIELGKKKATFGEKVAQAINNKQTEKKQTYLISYSNFLN